MPRSTVHRVAEEVLAIRHKVIHLQKTPEDLEAVCRGFAGLARHRAFLKAVGAIDGCHVHIKPPSGPDGQCYRNRKLFPSIILQAVCDHQGRFIDTYVGWPGSVHDARVLRHSPLYRRSVYPPPGHFILADGGYPCLRHPLPLITPYKRPVQGVGAQRFNVHHSRARSIIERAFGMMKTRFRAIFLQTLEVHHAFVPHVITTRAILHNICLEVGDIMARDDVAEEEEEHALETVVLPGVTSCLQRCLPWRRYPLTTSICNSNMTAVDCVSPANLLVDNAVDSGNMHSNTLETILDDVPPAERPYQGLYCGSPSRSSSSTKGLPA